MGVSSTLAVVKRMLVDGPGRLLEWSVEDGWESIHRFLGMPVPKNVKFPHVNASKKVSEESWLRLPREGPEKQTKTWR